MTSVLAYESTDFEATDARSIWARRSETNIDSLDRLSPTLRQLVDTTCLLFREPGAFWTLGSIAPFALYKKEARDPVLTSSGRIILQGQLLSVTPLSAAGVSLLPGIVEPTRTTGTMVQLGTVAASSSGSLAQTYALLQIGSQRFVSEWVEGLLLFNRGSTGYHPISDPTLPIGLQVEQIPLREDPKPNENMPDLADAAEKLHGWLSLTYDELAAITGIGKTTFFDWRRTERTPRPSTIHKLLRLYAVARAMVDVRGATDAAAWFRTGQPAPLDLLRRQDFAGVEQAAAAVLFRRPKGRGIDYTGFAPLPNFDIAPTDSSGLVRRTPRGARRVKLPTR